MLGGSNFDRIQQALLCFIQLPLNGCQPFAHELLDRTQPHILRVDLRLSLTLRSQQRLAGDPQLGEEGSKTRVDSRE